MNRLLPVILVLALAGLGFFLLNDPNEGSKNNDELTTQLAAIQAQLSSMEDKIAERDTTIESMQAAIAANRGNGMQRQPDTSNLAGLIDSAVAKALAERGGLGADALASNLEDANAEAIRAAIVPDAMRRLIDPLLGDEEREEIWAKIREEGLVKEAIAALEAEVEGNPDNADLLTELGYAYIQPIFSGEATGPEAGTWSMKSDQTYDRALAIDPEHWDARFSKAVSYSFWPPVFGKQAEAITHFETLIEQQGNRPREDRFVQTYQFLGNLYAQTGKQAEANAIWQKGLAEFPDDAQLKKSLGGE